MTKSRVLIVDDNSDVLAITARALVVYGFEVEAVDSGARALQILSEPDEAFDLLLTDVVMPEINGAELASQARDLQPDLEILFMSGYVDPNLEIEGALIPPDRLLHKPFSPAELVDRIRELLDK